MARRILFVLVAISVFVAICAYPDDDDDDDIQVAAKSVKTINKINDYLEKKVDSEDIEANVEKAMAWRKSKLSMLTDRSLKDTLKLFISLPKATRNFESCQEAWDQELLYKFDNLLADDAHMKTINYPLRRVDRIFESIAYRSVRLCRMDKWTKELKFGFKQHAYDQINSELVYHLPGNDDAEVNMKEAEKMLERLDDREGSYAKALELLLALRLTGTEDSCNEQGTEIVLKNDLASKVVAYSYTSYSLRRIKKIVFHYAAKHSKVCNQIFERNCLSLVNHLDLSTYRKLLALASAQHLKEEQFNEMFKQAEGKQLVDEGFTIPLIDNLTKVYRDMIGVVADSNFGTEKVIGFLASSGDSKAKYVGPIHDEKSGEKVVFGDKIKQLYNELVRDPCEKLTRLMKAQMEIFDYNWGFNEADGPLNFRLLRSVYQFCKNRANYHEDLVDTIVNKFERDIRPLEPAFYIHG